MRREPAVAGSFYPAQPGRLKAELSNYLTAGTHQHSAIGLLVPHAGYIYSGAIAAEAYKNINLPETVLLLGPDHHGLGGKATVYAEGSWLTPLGEVLIAETLAVQLLSDCDLLQANQRAHRREHSIEVQIPFLQMLRPDVNILPIMLGHGTLSDWLHLGCQLGESLRKWGQPVLLIASSDMNHFEPADTTAKVDRLALDQLERFDAVGLFKLVQEMNISMCGVIPAVVMLEAARVLGATTCQLLRYDHSGTVNNDLNSVVGYASMLID